MSAEPITLASGAATEIGRHRETNEDAVYTGRRLFAVVDGFASMGLGGGEVASAAIIDALRPLDGPLDAPIEGLAESLASGIEDASDELRRLCDERSAEAGASVTALLWSGRDLAMAHIGDTRAYLLRDQTLFQITTDHTLTRLLVEKGAMTEEEAEVSDRRRLLVRCLDSRDRQAPDLSARTARLGDRYLLCTDGLQDVDTRSIHHVLSTVREPGAATAELVAAANAAGGWDNVGCVVVDVQRPAVP